MTECWDCGFSECEVVLFVLGAGIFLVVFQVVAGYMVETGVDFLCIVFSPLPY